MSKSTTSLILRVLNTDKNIPKKSNLKVIGSIKSLNGNMYYYVLNKDSNTKYFISHIDDSVSILGSNGALIKISE